MALMQTLRPSRPTYMMTWQGMEILTPTEIEAFPSREVPREGEEVVLPNKVNSDFEGEPRDSPQQKRKRSRGRQNSQPRKKQRIDEAAILEYRLQRAAPIEMRSPNFWAKSKMKSRRLILEEDSSTESRRNAARGRLVQQAGPVAMAIEK
ncbi:hypothetical protein AXG93_3012s1020 [Marchantia polymorpha subsp. ruderalis]|uniref:Uncharacterized protein n=1 Tax=Marchantia polymorpha subsp. ruderalis TaxID=1480154 RepID=A0A176VCY9_MARPO|nr:hypothetical protein AXG93_3012s1020 [Marchantia polymorpha subsp. ruderalis]